MLKLIQKTGLIFLFGFIILFAFRLTYSYVEAPNGEPLSQHSESQNRGRQNWGFAENIKNYASLRKGKDLGQPMPSTGGGVIDQKYEKVANMALQTKAFEEDEKRIRDLITENSALIQFEQKEGLKGRRNLRLAIGVDPAKFDVFVEKAQSFGTLAELTINKSDKTNEYRELQAKRVSLEKTRDALMALKQKEGGDIKAMIELEQQILSMEQQIQDLGVSLGVFDKENEFVTVKFKIQEAGAAALRNISFISRSFVALQWSIKYYTLLCLAFAALAFSALVGTHLIRVMTQWIVSAEKGSETVK